MISYPKIIPASDSALIVYFGDIISYDLHRKVFILTKYLIDNPKNDIINIHPAYNSVMVSIEPSSRLSKTQEYLNKIIHDIDNIEIANEISEVEIPVVYGGEFGPDLDKVAKHCGLSIDEVIKQHSSAEYLVYFIGFSIGFPYLGGMDNSLATPRLEIPRKSVPKGAVAIAGSQTGIYPLSSPGGWNLIGSTPNSIFNVDNPKESMLKMGDILRFKSINTEEYEATLL